MWRLIHIFFSSGPNADDQVSMRFNNRVWKPVVCIDTCIVHHREEKKILVGARCWLVVAYGLAAIHHARAEKSCESVLDEPIRLGVLTFHPWLVSISVKSWMKTKMAASIFVTIIGYRVRHCGCHGYVACLLRRWVSKCSYFECKCKRAMCL